MVLLDSEGIDAASSVGYDDNQIFTLTVLLASVLIYNSRVVPKRLELEGLEYPLLTLSNFLVCLFAYAFLGGDKVQKKVEHGHARKLIVALFYFMIPLLFAKMSVYFIRWLKG